MSTVLTYSAIQTYQTCPQRYRYRYVDHLVPSKPWGPALRFGSLVHHGLEALHGLSLRANPGNWVPDDHWIRGTLAACTDPVPDEHELAVATGMLAGYVDAGGLSGITAIALEADLWQRRLFCGGDSVLRGKCDGLVEMGDMVWLIEHKTESQVTPAYVARVGIDLQIHLYQWLARERWPAREIAGVLYNVLPKPALRCRRGESLEEFSGRVRRWSANDGRYIRIPVPRDDHRIDDAVDDAVFVAMRIEGEETDIRNTGACAKPYPCPYLSICVSRHPESTIGTGFKKEAPHSELTQIGEKK